MECTSDMSNLSEAQYVPDDEISFRELVGVVWAGKWIIAGISTGVAIISLVVVLSMPNVYQSKALLAPAEENAGGGLSSQLGGLASLAGINLGAPNVNKSVISLEVLKSRSFLTDFVKRRELLVPLLAGKEWNVASGELVLKDDIYDVNTKKWIGRYSQGPSDETSFKAFNRILQVSQAKDSGIITLSLNHFSPLLAQQWLEWLISDINQQMRQRDIEEANRSIEYLKEQLSQTAVAGVQQVFYQLIEKQMQIVMLANVRDQYVFKVIDPPAIPEEKFSPKRGMIVILSVSLAFIVSLALVLILNALRDHE